MNVALLAAAISGLVSLGVAILAHKFNRERDRESDWRKLKLESYKEYVLALSGVVHQGRDQAAQRRYADAVNSFVLIAPPKVLEALYAFQDEITFRNEDRSQARYEELFSDLCRAMRIDCHPQDPKDLAEFTFRTLDIPPSTN